MFDVRQLGKWNCIKKRKKTLFITTFRKESRHLSQFISVVYADFWGYNRACYQRGEPCFSWPTLYRYGIIYSSDQRDICYAVR